MAEVRATRLSGYYAELKKFIENSNYPKVVKAANKILAEDAGEVEAWRCKIVAQINQDLFQEALTTATKSKLIPELAFEKAYCEYRLNKVDAAYDSISTVTEPNLRDRELKAQILYRLERYEECHEVYRDIIRTTSDDYDMERETNVAAVGVQRTADDDSTAEPDEDAAYELFYNSACSLLARGQIEAALNRLQTAREQCISYLTQDEATQDEINQEVAIVRVQEGHCLQLLGREKEALAIYNAVLKTKPDDPALLAIINNNLVAINRGANVFDSRKRMKVAMATGLEHKLTTKQRGTIALNHALLAYHTNQDEICQTEVQNVEQNFSHLMFEAKVLEAALTGRQGKTAEARKLLDKCASQVPQKSTDIALMATQILLAKGDREAACAVLAGVRGEDRHRQGIVAARVTLLTSLGKRQDASTVLREAVEWHRNNKTSAEQLGALWREAADFHLRSGDAATAAASLLDLHRLDPSNVMTLAQLITAYAQYDVPAAQKLSASLPSVKKVVGDLDVVALEATPAHRHARKAVTSPGTFSPGSPRSPGSETRKSDDKKNKKKKKRKTRLPKNYNPEVTPDPERWLPRWQRKGFRKRRDRRVKDVMKGTQGVSSDAADKFDITKTAGTHKPASQPVSTPPETHHPRRNVQKKKGGGKKKKGGW